MAILEIKDLSFQYSGAPTKALCDINLQVEEGEFVLLCGESGCGKTTLLRLMKPQIRPEGMQNGTILYSGTEIRELSQKNSVCDIGYVPQRPENAIVTDKVFHELAFGLEGMEEKNDVIRRKVAEICGFLGIGDWYHQKTCELSGGQKQLLLLASVLVMQPKILLLDEPCGQLDPIAASGFITALRKLNDDLGITVILAEHRLEEIFPIATKVVMMDRAKVFVCDTPRKVGQAFADGSYTHKLSLGLPTSVRLFAALGGDGTCPLTVKEGKAYVASVCHGEKISLPSVNSELSGQNTAIEIKEGYFRYARELPDVLQGLDLTVYENEILCILGANGAGKTTLLRVIGGMRRLYRGKYRLWGKKIKEYTGNTLYRNNISALPQDPQTLFVGNTVYEDLRELTKILEYGKKEAEEKIGELTEKLEIAHLCCQHPYDLSGGEAQKAALCKVLLTDPKILLLDEPTKGLDAFSKQTLAEILHALKAEGKTIVMVTHDVEFAAEYADRCAMFFDGRIVSVGDNISFFAQNSYYTTACARITRSVCENAVTFERTVEALSGIQNPKGEVHVGKNGK